MTQPRDAAVFNGVQNFLNELRQSPLAKDEPVATWLDDTEHLMQDLIIENQERIPDEVLEDVNQLESITRTLSTNRGDAHSYSNVARWAKSEVENLISSLSRWNVGLLIASDNVSPSSRSDLSQARASIETAISKLTEVIQERESRIDRGELSQDSSEDYELAVLRDVAVPTLMGLVERLDNMGRDELSAWGGFLQRLASIARHPLAVEALSQAAIQLRKAF